MGYTSIFFFGHLVPIATSRTFPEDSEKHACRKGPKLTWYFGLQFHKTVKKVVSLCAVWVIKKNQKTAIILFILNINFSYYIYPWNILFLHTISYKTVYLKNQVILNSWPLYTFFIKVNRNVDVHEIFKKSKLLRNKDIMS